MSSTQALLDALGRRIRALREDSGESVTSAAEGADVSRRTWTELEAGRANPSLLVLARVAGVLGVAPADLLQGFEPRRPSERIALLGIRGAGKSTVGPLLARELDAPFVELDSRVEDLAGLGLGELFELHGAASFHRFEREALERVLAGGERQVLATGGSIVEASENFDRLLATCRTVWLRAAPATHMERVRAQGDPRPMRGRPRAMEELEELLEGRAERYGRAELTLETDGTTPEELVSRILGGLGLGPQVGDATGF